MKIETRDIEGVLRDATRFCAVLLHGEDAGLIRERARRVIVTAAGSADDPFRVTELSGDDAKRVGPALAGELAGFALGGGRRVVRVPDAGDTLAAEVQAILRDGCAGLLVLEAGQLGAASKLRAAIEKSAGGAAIGCYVPEARALGAAIAAELKQAGVTADADAVGWLAGSVSGGLDAALAEAGKAALYAGAGGRIDLADMRASAGDGGASRLEEVFLAMMAGDLVALEAALQAAWSADASAVAVLRGGLLHFQRLRAGVRLVAEGRAAAEAVRSLRPPVFYKQQALFVAALSALSTAAVDRVLLVLWQAERACKATGAPAEALCSQAVWRCARMARGG